MTISEEIKLQAKLLEWEAPKGLSANLKGYNTGDYIWVTNGIVVARIYSPCYMLNVLPSLESIKEFTMLSLGAVKGWLTPTQWRDNEYGVCVKVETYDMSIWVTLDNLELFGNGGYDVWIGHKGKFLWLTEMETKEVIGVIAGVRGINERLEALRHEKGDKNGRN